MKLHTQRTAGGDYVAMLVTSEPEMLRLIDSLRQGAVELQPQYPRAAAIVGLLHQELARLTGLVHSTEEPLARLATHEPVMRSQRVTEVPIGSIMSLYGANGPREFEILDRVRRGDSVVLVFADGMEVPYELDATVFAFKPLAPASDAG